MERAPDIDSGLIASCQPVFDGHEITFVVVGKPNDNPGVVAQITNVSFSSVSKECADFARHKHHPDLRALKCVDRVAIDGGHWYAVKLCKAHDGSRHTWLNRLRPIFGLGKNRVMVHLV